MLDLRPESTVRELSLYDFQIEADQMGKEVAQAFEVNPLLPGAILTEAGQFMGMISRRRFLEHMSRPYGLELFLKRPLKALHRFAARELSIVPGNMLVIEAANRSLQRSPDLLYEPIVVQTAPTDYRLLDAHHLLVAQSQILLRVTQLLEQLYRELESANQQLQRLASLDGLTQVANRRQFDAYLETEWRRLMREEKPLSLIMCDVDYFKLYNDTYGHQAGDECLKKVALAISTAAKRPADLAARYGGEEFAVVLPNTDASGAVHVAQLIRSQLRDCAIAHEASAVSESVTLSFGVASLVPTFRSSPDRLIAAADAVLYRAKQQGRDRIILSQSFS